MTIKRFDYARMLFVISFACFYLHTPSMINNTVSDLH